MNKPVLYLGNKRYSSWSLRAWLAMKMSRLTFDEVVIPLDTPEFAARIEPLSPMRTVPVLHVGDDVIWDSVAICEWAAEQAPKARLWPEAPEKRAVARSLVASMHAGFSALRTHAPMNLGRDAKPRGFPDDLRKDIDTIEMLWREHRDPAGPYFFGDWSIVDAFWTPVASRLRSYSIDVEPAAQAYVDVLLADPEFQNWRASALAETYENPLNDDV